MTPTAAGAWWDPDADPSAAARVPSHPRAHLSSDPAPRPAAGTSGEPVHDAGVSRWWAVGVVACGVLALAAAVAAVLARDGWWAAAAVALAAAAVATGVAERSQPRRVEASSTGVRVASRGGGRDVAWGRLRRVRGPRVMGFERLDTHLELDTGELVPLPRRTPGGVVEGWRQRFDGDRPVPRLPQEWRLTEPEAAQQRWLPHVAGPLAGISAVNLANAFAHPPLPAFVVLYVAVMGLMVVALRRLRPVRAVRADEHGLTLPGRRRRHIRWSQVQDIRRKGRYDPETVVELTTGEQRELLTPDLDTLTEWRALAAGAQDR